MKIAIDRNVPIPAYQQVVDGVADAVTRGDLRRGSRLPSVRNLAVDLGLNVNTVARAYRDLERAGVILTMPGMGTFVADVAPQAWVSRSSIRGGGAPDRAFSAAAPAGLAPGAPLSTSWRDLLAAASALASADGMSEEEFLSQAADVARAGLQRATLLVVTPSTGEAADILRALPTSLTAVAAAVTTERLRERVKEGGISGVLTSFPALPAVRSALGDLAESVPVLPVETELTESAVRGLAELPPAGRLALLTIEKENWDHEANDVLKIIGRSRWLKMVLLEHGERGLAERLEQVDCVLYVPRARTAVEAFEGSQRTLVELTRQVTSRTRERILHAAGPGG